MVEYFSTSIFRNSIKDLTKKPKNGYVSVCEDICKCFTSKDILETRINRELIIQRENYSLIKLRVGNSYLRLSKKDGFRLIYLVLLDEEMVIFLDVFPKRGKLGLSSIGPKFLKDLISTFENEKDSEMLVRHDVGNMLLEAN